MVTLRFLGTMILSSMKTRPNRLDSFLLCIWYSSGISSCCCRSKLTSVFSNVGSLMVSVISSCRSVEKFFSVSRTVCSRSQLFSSSAATLGACPIFTYCTLFTPTYRAQFHAGTSRMDGSWSVSDSISPSWVFGRIGVVCLLLLTMVRACHVGFGRVVVVGPVLVGPRPRMDLLSIVLIVWFVVGNRRCAADRFFVLGLLVVDLA